MTSPDCDLFAICMDTFCPGRLLKLYYPKPIDFSFVWLQHLQASRKSSGHHEQYHPVPSGLHETLYARKGTIVSMHETCEYSPTATCNDMAMKSLGLFHASYPSH